EIEEIYQSNKYLEVKKILKDITAREFATAIALRKAIKKLKIKNAISFHRSIRRADNFRVQQDLITKIFPSYGKLKSFHVRGDMPTSDRAIQMRNFAEGEGLMTNARCLTEGVDLPAIDCVVFTDPKRSKVDIVQAAGRALRLSKDKKFGYILIPIFIPDGADFNEAAEEQGFDDVAVTVRALATTDTRITEYLRVISEGKKPKGGSPVDGLTSVNSLYKVEAEEFDKAIKLKVWDKVAYGNWRPYEEAKKYSQSLKLKNTKEWHKYTKLNIIPKDIPKYPNEVYIQKWNGWGDFLGTGRIADQFKIFKTYEEAKRYVHRLNIKSVGEWSKYNKLKNFPKDIPKNPNGTYKNDWKGWGDFLGTRRVANRLKKFRSYNDAKKYAHSLKFKNQREWFKHIKSKGIPKDISTSPQTSYKNKGWKNWGDFLGTGRIADRHKVFRKYEDAKKYVQSSKLKNQNEWIKFTKSKNFPHDIPKAPHSYYKKEWTSLGEFLGTGIIATHFRKYKSFNDARKYCRSLNLKHKYKGLKSAQKWFLHIKTKGIPENIPSTVNIVYKKEWKGWPDFLGRKTKS
ncbi:helicase-related protein, partial [Candidatus Pelagibacter ubique]|nr:helicase-related protein [Candidatus Pelagibacter ubique]